MIACPSCKLVGPETAAYCQHCGSAMKPPLMVTRQVPVRAATVAAPEAKGDPGWWGRQSDAARGGFIAAAAVAVIGLLVIVGAATGTKQSASTSGGGPSGSSIQWTGALNELYDPVHSYDAAMTAGNIQGALTAKTTIIRHCQDYASLGAGGGQVETNVRSVCARVGQPLR